MSRLGFIGASNGAVLAMLAALRSIRASLPGSFLNLVPLFEFAGASLFLHEAISWQRLLLHKQEHVRSC
nr:hypothetical protein [uncultured Rhodoferax sp.]